MPADLMEQKCGIIIIIMVFVVINPPKWKHH